MIISSTLGGVAGTTPLEQVMETVFSNMCETSLPAIPKAYNIAAYLNSLFNGYL